MAIHLCVGLFLLAACSAGSSPTMPPTVPLIRATETPSPTPIPPSATPQTLTDPISLGISTLEPPSTSPAAPPDPDDLLAVDPVAAELVGIARRLLSEQLDLPSRRIQVVDVRAVVWQDSALGCARPGIVPVEVNTPGYRIVLRAAETDYLYHTDFDRVFPCAFEDERLPEDMALETADPALEVTDETTPGSGAES